MSDETRFVRLRSAEVLLAMVVSLPALALYVTTLQPDFGGPEDTTKFQLVGYVLGTAHPPGYPLYVMLSHLFVQLPIGSIAYRANLFSAVMAAVACGLAFLISRKIGAGRWAAVCAATGLATGSSYWRSAVFAEVYGLAAVMATLTILLLIVWGTRGGTRWLLASVATFGLGLGNHLISAGVAPGAVIYALLRDRFRLTLRVLVAAAFILCVCLSQYLFIIVRTNQEAAYLESRATSLQELVGVITAQRFSNNRFAFSPMTLLTEQAPEAASFVSRDLGVGGVLLLAAGVIAAVRRRSLEVGLIVAAAAGMFAMLVNLRGETTGYVTPLMALVWPVAGYGLEAIIRSLRPFGLVLGVETVDQAVRSLRSARVSLTSIVLVASVAIPLTNLVNNYETSDQSSNTAHAQFFHAVYAQLPARAAFVAENYFIDSSLKYMNLTDPNASRKQIVPLGFGASAVRDAARDNRAVFALAAGATFLGTAGLRFEPSAFRGPQLDIWLHRLPHGTLVVGAIAQAPVPYELLGAEHRPARQGRPRQSFATFAFVTGQAGIEIREADTPSVLEVDAALVKRPLPALPGQLIASADTRNARVQLDGRSIAKVEMGLAISAFTPDGALLQAFEVPSGQTPTAPLAETVYELMGEAPCAVVGSDGWTDVSAVLTAGSVLASISGFGTMTIEATLAGAAGSRVRAVELLGGGSARTLGWSRGSDDVDVVAIELSRTRTSRPAYKLAFGSMPQAGRARLRPGAVQPSITLCSDEPASLFAGNANQGVIGPEFDDEAYFGTGWSGPERTPTGITRRGDSGAALLLPLDAGHAYRVALDVETTATTRLEILLNATSLAVCELGAQTPCEVTVPAALVRPGVNELSLSFTGSSAALPFRFRRARLWRLASP